VGRIGLGCMPMDWGYFGRSEDEFTWERTDKVEALRGLLRR